MKKFLLALLITLMPLAVFAGGSVAVNYGQSISGESGDIYGIEGRWAQNGFYGSVGYQDGMDWRTVTTDAWRVTTTKEGEVDSINLGAGIVSAIGGVEVTAGGVYSRLDYGDQQDWEPGMTVGASYAITDNISAGVSAQRTWTDRIGTVDSLQGQLRYSF